MEVVLFIALCFSGIFAFAFGMAWFLPLASARSNIVEETPKRDVVFPLLDIVLMLFDCIPFFWFFRVLPTSSAAHQEVRRLWKEEESIRNSFYSFVWSVATSVILIGILIAINA